MRKLVSAFRFAMLLAAASLTLSAQSDRSMALFGRPWYPGILFGNFKHPAVGSWFGKAAQACVSPTDPTCFQVALFMTPTLNDDGSFLGNDSLALGGPPFGPHTTAHGKWVATSPTDIIADYVFMLPASAASSVSVLRFRWQASVVRWDTMVGYVNIFFGPEVPMTWENITPGNFPALPNEALPALTPPAQFYTDPANCPSGPPACPLVFRFTIKRVEP
ncbi:MAG: hypothetical protein ABL967_14320 [Bryobacteraceae bacterium]